MVESFHQESVEILKQRCFPYLLIKQNLPLKSAVNMRLRTESRQIKMCGLLTKIILLMAEILTLLGIYKPLQQMGNIYPPGN